jgi:hypothetical protein
MISRVPPSARKVPELFTAGPEAASALMMPVLLLVTSGSCDAQVCVVSVGDQASYEAVGDIQRAAVGHARRRLVSADAADGSG